MAISSRSDMKTLQVTLPAELDSKLENISARSHVAKSVIIRMGVQLILKEITEGRIKVGFSFGEE